MWWNIIKNVKTVSQTQGSFDFEEEEIPEEEETNCLKKLKEYYNRAKNHPYAIKENRQWNIKNLSEEAACAIIKHIDSVEFRNQRTFTDQSGEVHNLGFVITTLFDSHPNSYKARKMNSYFSVVIVSLKDSNDIIIFGTHNISEKEMKPKEIDWRR
tara:strand:+ start:4189 stop:4656 length:468 start_codon:yes stop_codon:yes gene_type:complete